MYVVILINTNKRLFNMHIVMKVILFFSTLLITGCHLATTPSIHNAVAPHNAPTANTLSMRETLPLKGSEKVSVHAYSYTRGSDACSRTVAINFSSTLDYTHTLIELRNRALVTGANALSITGWNEFAGHTTLTAHFFDCQSKKGL